MRHFAPFSLEYRLWGASMMTIMIATIPIWGCIKYCILLGKIKKYCPTKEEQEKLRNYFEESVCIFDGDAMIGRDYSFLRKQMTFVETKQIERFSYKSRDGRYGKSLDITAVLNSEYTIYIKRTRADDEGRDEANKLIHDANDVLNDMRTGS